jgi:hypothetical protein
VTAGPHGSVAAGYEAVAEAFAENVRERGEVGAAFAAVVDGAMVVDLWGGFADAARTRPWERDTVCGVFSGTKGLVATCLVVLVDRGRLYGDGSGGSVHGAWPAQRVGFSHVPNLLRGGATDERGTALLSALHRSLRV